jgi:hypothetical protein
LKPNLGDHRSRSKEQGDGWEEKELSGAKLNEFSNAYSNELPNVKV